MRLIDADAFKKEIAGMCIKQNLVPRKCNAVCELIDTQPTAYDMDKVVRKIDTIPNGRLSGYPNCCEYDYGLEVGFKECAREAIEIVRKEQP